MMNLYFPKCFRVDKITGSILLVFLLSPAFSSAQSSLRPSVFNLAGETSKSEAYTLNWSIGESATSTLQLDEFFITQGFQQVFTEPSTAVLDPAFEGRIKWFPNPVESILNLQTDYTDPLELEIYSLLGQRLYSTVWTSFKEVSVGGLTPGTYLLKCSEQGNPVYSSLFIKH